MGFSDLRDCCYGMVCVPAKNVTKSFCWVKQESVT